jgi:hypothetical protein
MAPSASEQTASSQAAAQADPGRDVQTLISLLGDMMPLLLRIQSSGAGQIAGFGSTDIVLNPLLDRQAAINFVENAAADALQTLSHYVEQRTAQSSGVDMCRPIVTQATNCLAAHDYAQAFNLIWQAYRLIAALRAVNPQLPPLRSAAAKNAAVGSSDRASTQH